MEEKIFFQDGGITVTNTRYLTFTRTFAVRNISSVYSTTIKPDRLLPIILLLFGAFVCFGSLAANSDYEFPLSGIVMILSAIIWLALQKNKYAVIISTNAGENRSVVSQDPFFIETIVSALNEAITYTIANNNLMTNISITNPAEQIDNKKIHKFNQESKKENSANDNNIISTHNEKIAKLKELKELLDSGTLTQSEFDQLKSQIL